MAWKTRGAVAPAVPSVIPVGSPIEAQGVIVAEGDVAVLHNGAPEGPPSP